MTFNSPLPALLLFATHAAAADLNVAVPGREPYIDPAGDRADYPLSSAPVNEARIYNFYQRQADYCMSQPPGTLPTPLPAFPGLDGGIHGHWGKNNQNDYEDGRWNQTDLGPVWQAMVGIGKARADKGVCIKLGGGSDLAACFDPLTASWRGVWHGFLTFNPNRWGMSRGTSINGKIVLSQPDNSAWLDPAGLPLPLTHYAGFHLHGHHVILDYHIADTRVLDQPGTLTLPGGDLFTRTLTFPGGHPPAAPAFLPLPPDATPVPGPDPSLALFQTGDRAWILAVSPGGSITTSGPVPSATLTTATARLYQWQGNVSDSAAVISAIHSDTPLPDLTTRLAGGPLRWPQTVTLTGKTADSASPLPYVIDTIPVPLENPYRSLMMFSGIDFLPNGDAAVCTLMGDVWIVSGLDASLRKITWKRFATGLAIPFGLKVINGKIHIAGKHQITVLHDQNADGEADFFENWANDYLDTHGHPHLYGLGKDPQGNAYIIDEFDIARIDAITRKTTIIANGVRNCMGLGYGHGLLLAAPQEGEWTPASMIIEVHPGEHYGFKRTPNQPVGLPLCYVPRAIDNSTGGFAFIDNEKWGPLGHSILGLSYGYGSHYLILRDASQPRAQGAVVPLPGDFTSGVLRSASHPLDGQLYLVGTEGWGNYATQDGCLNRVRYTGRETRLPIGFRVHRNGLRIDFTCALDPSTITDLRRYLCQQWNYEYASRYGSPEFSIRLPNSLGHDIVNIRSVHLLEGARSLFLEIPDLSPAMQMYVRMHLTAADGTAFNADLFPTIIQPGQPFTAPGLAPVPPGQPVILQPRIKGESASASFDTGSPPDESWISARRITIQTIEGLKYDISRLTASPGERLALTLHNADVMPHNLVLIQPGAAKTVGEAAMNMLNDPDAGEKHYIPDTPGQVLAHTHIVQPGRSYTLYLTAPVTPGAYPWICTFPGHWMLMQGLLEVKP